MRVYDINREKKEINTECGLFQEGDYVQVTLLGENTPTKYQLVGVFQDGIRTFFLLHNEECGMTTTEADVDIDDMIKIA